MSLAAVLSRVLAAFAVVAAILAAPAAAAPVKTPHLEVELVAQGEMSPGSQNYVALIHRMEEGWHTYWRNSGDSGAPTQIIWTLPPGWSVGNIVWAAPERIPFATLMNYGYSNEVVLPVRVTPPASARAGDRATLKAVADFLVCKDICVPEQAIVSLDVVIGGPTPAADPKWGGVIAKALGEAPKPAGLKAAATRDGENLRISITGDAVKGGEFPQAYFFPFSPTVIQHAAPQEIERGPDGLTLTLALAPNAPEETIGGVLSLGGSAFEIEAVPGPVLAGATGLGSPKGVDVEGAAPLITLPAALAFAFLGGLILNLMPCVFPVLSMKAASLALHAHEARAARAQGLAFLAGVLVTFLALAGALIAAKAAGSAVGWGFQLQSPPVVAALALLMLLIALNLSGLFEIGLSAQGVGTGLASRSGLAGAFFTGSLAVVVAAPCTAPFMAAALGYAISQPAPLALLIFTSLGLGFALPFTALAFAPNLLKRMPRPGAWMNIFKTALSFPMYGAAAWLAWVFAAQTGQMALAALFAAALVVAVGAWLFGQGQRQFALKPKVILQGALPVAVAIAALLLYPVARTATADDGVQAAQGALPSEPWSPERVAALRAEGRPVFVDFTADWCVTCKVNEGAALSSKAVAQAFADNGVVFLKADWTKRDDVIAKALAEHGRAGVPLYLLYPAGGGDPRILPQLLTEGMVKAAVEEAAKT